MNNTNGSTQIVDPLTGLTTMSQPVQRTGVAPLQDPLVTGNSIARPEVQGTRKATDLDKTGHVTTFPGQNRMEALAQKQRRIGALGYTVLGAARLGTTAVAKWLEGMGFVASLLAKRNIHDAVDTGLSQFLGAIEDELKHRMPVYTSQRYLEGNFLQKLRTPEFWANDFVDGVAFLGSALLGGGLVGKIVGSLGKVVNSGKIVSKLATPTARAVKAFDTAEDAMAAGKKVFDVAKFNKGVNNFAITTYNTVSESMFEAHEVKQSTIEHLLKKINPATGQFYTEEEASQIAGNAAYNTFWSNMAILALPNAFQTQMLFGRYTKGLSKLPTSKAKGMLAKGGIGILMEGFGEENAQLAISRVEEDLINRSFFDKERIAQIGNNFLNGAMALPQAIVDPKNADTEAATSVFLGALIGGGMGAYGGAQEFKTYQARLKKSAELGKRLYAGVKGFAELDQDGKIKFDEETGKPIVNEKELTRRVYEMIFNEELFNEHMAASAIENDFAKNLVEEIAFSRDFLRNIFDMETFTPVEELMDIYKETVKLRAESAKEEGEDEAYVTQRLAHFQGRIDDYTKLIRGLAKNVSLFEDLSQEEKETYFAAQFYEGIKQLAVERQVNELQKELTEYGNDPVGALEKEKIQKRIEGLQEYLADSFEGFRSYQNVDDIKKTIGGIEKQFASVLTDTLKKTQERLSSTTSEEDKAAAKEEIEALTALDALAIDQKTTSYGKIVNPLVASYPNIVNPEDVRRELSSMASNRSNFYYSLGKDFRIRSLAKESLEQSIAANEVNTDVAKAYKEKEAINSKDAKLIEEAIAHNEKKKQELSEKNEQLNEQLNTALQLGDDIDPNIETEIEQTEAAIIQTTSEITKLEQLLDKAKSLDAKLAQLAEFDETNESDLVFLQELVYQNIKKALAKLNAFEKDPENYIDVLGLSRSLMQLEVLKDLFTLREDFATPREEAFRKDVLSIFEQYIPRLQEAIAQATENLNNRDKQQRAHELFNRQTLYSMIGVNIDTALADHEVIDENLFNIVKNILGDNYVNNLLENAKKYEEPYHEAFMYILFDELRNKSNTAELKEYLTNRANEIRAKLPVLIQKTSNPQRMYGALFSEQYYPKRNPDEPFYSGRPGTALYMFDADPDISKIEDYVEKDEFIKPESKQTLLSNLDKVNTLVGYYNFSLFLNSKSNLVDQLVAENNVKNKLAKVEALVRPTPQQKTAMRQIVNFLTSPVKKGRNNLVFLSGIAGGGKTNVVARWIKNILNYTDDEVLVMGHTDSSTKTISKSIFGIETKGVSFEDFDAALLKGKKLIMFDEMPGVYSETELNKFFEAIDSYNAEQETENKIRVLGLGDPTQITLLKTSPYSLASSSRSYMFTVTQQLSLSYRSVNPAINDAMNSYRFAKESRNSDLITQANADVNEARTTNKGLTGVLKVNSSDIPLIISKRKGDNKKRLVIVANDDAKRKYANLVDDNTEVLTYIDAQGRTVDEVYIDMDISDVAHNKDVFTEQVWLFNKAMYVAISRAKTFAAVTDSEVQTQRIDNLEESGTNAQAEYVKNQEHYDTWLKQALDIFDKNLDGFVKPPEEDDPASLDISEDEETPAEGEQESELEDEEAASNFPLDEPTPPHDIPEVKEGEHQIEFPEYKNAKNAKPGDEVIYTKIRANFRGNKRETAYAAFIKTSANHAKLLGILSTEEVLDIFGSFSEADKDDFTPQSMRSLKDQDVLVSALKPIAHGIVKDAKGITFTYAKGYRKAVLKPLELFDKIKNLFKRREIFKKGRREIKDLEWNKTELKIFNDEEITKLEKQNVLHPGAPYLVVSQLDTDDENSKLYIRLNPRNYSKEDTQIQTIGQAAKLFKAIEEVMTQAGFPMILGGRNSSREFNALVRAFEANYEGNVADKNDIKRKSTTVTKDDVIANILKAVQGLSPVFYNKETGENTQKYKNFEAKLKRTYTQEVHLQVQNLVDELVPLVAEYKSTKRLFESEEEIKKLNPNYTARPSRTGKTFFAIDETGEYLTTNQVKFDGGSLQRALNHFVQSNSSNRRMKKLLEEGGIPIPRLDVRRKVPAKNNPARIIERKYARKVLQAENDERNYLEYVEMLNSELYEKGFNPDNYKSTAEKEAVFTEDELDAMKLISLTPAINSQTLGLIAENPEQFLYQLDRGYINSVDMTNEKARKEASKFLTSPLENISPTYVIVELTKEKKEAKPKEDTAKSTTTGKVPTFNFGGFLKETVKKRVSKTQRRKDSEEDNIYCE